MKAQAATIARSLVEAAQQLPQDQLAGAVDHVLATARRLGVSQRDLRKALRSELRKADKTLSVRLTTVSGDAGDSVAAISSAISKTLDRPVHLQEDRAPLLGGAILTVGNDRLDYSLRSALDRAQATLSHS